MPPLTLRLLRCVHVAEQAPQVRWPDAVFPLRRVQL